MSYFISLCLILSLINLPSILFSVPRLLKTIAPKIPDFILNKLNKIASTALLITMILLMIIGCFASFFTGLKLMPLIPFNNLSFYLNLAMIISLTSIGLFSIIHILIHGSNYLKLPSQNKAILNQLINRLGLKHIIFIGLSEQTIALFGVMNSVLLFFILMFKSINIYFIGISILFSSTGLTMAQVPVLIAAGCTKSRSFLYLMVIINLIRGLVLGMLFWHYGLISALICNILVQCFCHLKQN